VITQHCGRLDTHLEHTHSARPKQVILSCICDMDPCICDGQPLRTFELVPKEEMMCSGKQEREGAPPHLPVEVAV
jgi:hypothetical protein